MTTEKRGWKQMLPYAGLAVIVPVLWLLHRGADPLVLLLQEALAVFGYFAALGDLREKRIPNQLVAAMLGGWCLILVPQLFYRPEYALRLGIQGGVGFLLAGAVFLTVYLVSRKGLGGGDVKFMAAAGLYLGADVLPAMLYGSVFSAVTSVGLLLAKRIQRNSTIPLAPFLYAGMLITIVFTQA